MSEKSNEDRTRFVCCNIGLTMERVKIVQLPSGEWEATQPIGTIFGCEVNGECSGTGTTREAALLDLALDRRKLSDSIWE